MNIFLGYGFMFKWNTIYKNYIYTICLILSHMIISLLWFTHRYGKKELAMMDNFNKQIYFYEEKYTNTKNVASETDMFHSINPL